MGMAIVPISRHSALASFFKISVATALAFRMLTAYTLFTLVLTHVLLYVSWIPVFEALPKALRMVYPVTRHICTGKLGREIDLVSEFGGHLSSSRASLQQP